MQNLRHTARLLGVLLSASAATAAFAACPEGGGDQNRPKGPPPEAVAACKGKTAGATVTLTMRDGKTMTGVCEQQGAVLAARPQGMGGKPPEGGGRGGMPPPPDGAGSAPPPPPRCGNEGGSSK